MELAEVMKALSHKNRLRILNLLNQKTLCVSELTNIMEVNQSNASRHLSKLAQADLIEQSRDGNWIYYFIKPESKEKYPFLEPLLKGMGKEKELLADLEKLQIYEESGIDCSELKYEDLF
ncbi:MAG: ArsR/SmtB family transcription factor [Halarsenatibacteraceae bacterium]